jgi:hypothetical protein
VPPTSLGSGNSIKLLDADENGEFQKLFKDLIQSKKQICTKLMRSRLEGHKTLSHLSETLSGRQLGDKIRTERQIWLKNKGKGKK